MRCYFHVISDDGEHLDETGVEVASISEARAEALNVVDELSREDPSILSKWEGWTLRITDQSGRVLSSTSLGARYDKLVRTGRAERSCDWKEPVRATESH